jgi:hypothetical protein
MKSLWKNKKYPGTYYGTHARDADGERVFILKRVEKARRITFESWQAAKALGWVKK